MANDVHVEKLAIYSANGKINEREIRNYVIEKWEHISKGMNNTSILFMAGVHGSETGAFKKRADSFNNIMNQVRMISILRNIQ